ncbi:MAG: PVC-type heme-binding CxxCH protein [Verrucomicrobiales bacterium]
MKKLIGVCSVLMALAGVQADGLSLKKGDHVSLIGNALPERMQHDGWLESYLQAAFPEQELSFRNLGFSGDELAMRLRSENFGKPDDWLTRTKASVVFAFFGYNESHGGEAGLAKFKKDLEKFIKDTKAQKYNGSDSPQLVIFSPIAHENHKNPNLPDGKENNKRIKLYTEAMAEIAKANDVTFIDLYAPTLEAYGKAKKPLTINGLHLNEEGNKVVAQIIAKFLAPDAKIDEAKVAKLRPTVKDKNFYWFNRYRVQDGYNVYGGRSLMKYAEDLSNRTVMDREMEVLDVMTANRDKKIWALAQGKNIEVDDSNTPPFIPVKTNKQGKGPNGEHIYLSGEEAIKHMKPAKGMKVNLFADEKMFPILSKPVQMGFDTKGRLWVASWPNYPHWKPKDPMDDKLLIFEDTTGDGVADKYTVFADNLNSPTGFDFYQDGVIVAETPDLLFLRDTDGDGRYDSRTRIIHGLDSADSHHAANSFVWGPGGDLFFQEGTFHHTQVESIYEGPVRCANGGVFRFGPKRWKFETFISYGYANPHGHVFDRWGQNFNTDGTGNQNYFAAAYSGKIDFPKKHKGIAPFFQQRSRPAAATEILSSKHFPEEMQGNYLIANVIGFQGIFQYKFQDEGSGFNAKEVEPIVVSDDPNFRPVDMEIGPDGALYFLDWQNAIIGHLQHHLRDPSRDKVHGRIYRVTYPERPLTKPVRIEGESIPNLLNALKDSDDRVRYRAKIELGGRNSQEVVAEAKKWAASLDEKDPEYQHHLLEALWVHQYHNVVDESFLKKMLRSPDYRARAAATRVLCYWRDRVQNPLELLKVQVQDEHPRVRLEAVRACSFFTTPEAAEVALMVLEKDPENKDRYIKYTLEETMTQLEKFTK